MPRTETPSLFPEPVANPPARDEMNFAEFPMAVLTARAPKDCLELVFSDVVMRKSGPVTRKLTVTTTPKYGLPTPKDEEVLLGLVTLTKRQNNFTDRTVYFTRHELLKLLGLNNEGHSYQRLEESLHRWAAVYLHYQNAWWDNEAKAETDVAFHVIDGWQITKGEGRRGGQVTMKWNDVVLKSFRSNYVKQLDLTFYQSLQSAVTKRLYRFLDKQLYRKTSIKLDLANVAYAHVGIMQTSPLFKAKQTIEHAVLELEDRGYLEKVPPSERWEKQARGKWNVLFVKKVAGSLETSVEEAESEAPDLCTELVARGFTDIAARKALAKPPKVLLADTITEHVKLCLEAFDWTMNRKDKPKRPKGFLYSLITEGYLPDGFTPAATIKQQVDERNRQVAEQARKNREKDAEQRAEQTQKLERRQRVDAYLEDRSPEERKRFEEAAINAGSPEDVQSYRKYIESGFFAKAAEELRYKFLDAALSKSTA